MAGAVGPRLLTPAWLATRIQHLDAIVNKFSGGPVGLTTLAIAVGEEPETIEAAYEPFLELPNRNRPRGPF